VLLLVLVALVLDTVLVDLVDTLLVLQLVRLEAQGLQASLSLNTKAFL
jgi:hypothetical protein